MSQGAPRRLFVAIFPPEPALDHLEFVVDDLEMSVRAKNVASCWR
jgi:hypothetical protein